MKYAHNSCTTTERVENHTFMAAVKTQGVLSYCEYSQYDEQHWPIGLTLKCCEHSRCERYQRPTQNVQNKHLGSTGGIHLSCRGCTSSIRGKELRLA